MSPVEAVEVCSSICIDCSALLSSVDISIGMKVSSGSSSPSSSAEIAERLWADAGFREVDEAVFALPFGFPHDDYVQIVTDIAGALGPALGWAPRGCG